MTYLSSHYHDGIVSVFAKPEQFIIQIVANKYNPANYWQVVSACCALYLVDTYIRSGRWRSQYDINVEEKTVVGKILVNVHYYEQGNVSFRAQRAESNQKGAILGSTRDDP